MAQSPRRELRPTNRRQVQEGGLKGLRAHAQLVTETWLCGGVGELGAGGLVLALRIPEWPLPLSPALTMFLTRSEYDRSVWLGEVGWKLRVGGPGARSGPGFCRVMGAPQDPESGPARGSLAFPSRPL